MNPFPAKAKSLQMVLLLLGMLLFGYNIWRANQLSFTHDEAISFQYLDHSYMEIISYNAPPFLPNNHILNTVGMKLMHDLGFDSPWALRIPIMLSFGFYLWYCGLLMLSLRSPWLAVLGFILLCLQPYLLDFFGLARGYAMGCALMMGSLQQYSRWLQESRPRHLTWAFAFAGLSIFANLTFLNFLLALGLFHLCHHFLFSPRTDFKTFFRLHRGAILALLATIIFAYEPVRKVAKFGMAYGGTNGFWQDTAQTLIYNSIPQISSGPALNSIANLMVPTSVLLMAGWCIFEILRKKPPHWPFVMVFCTLLLLGLSTLLQFLLLGTPYLYVRTALIFIPPYLLALVLFVDALPIKLPAWAQMAASLPIMGALILGFKLQHRPDQVREWPLDRNNEKVLAILAQNLPPKADLPIHLGNTWYFEPSLNYYRITRKIDWLSPLDREGFDPSDDFILLGLEDYWNYPKEGLKILLDDPQSEMLLALPEHRAATEGKP